MRRQIDQSKLSPEQMAKLLFVRHTESDEHTDCNNGFNKALEQICDAPDAFTIARIRVAQNRWSEEMNDITASATATAFEIMQIASDKSSFK